MSLALIYRYFLFLSHWRFFTMPLCRLFPPPPTSAASPLSQAWLLINLSLLDLSSSVWSTSLCAPPSYPLDLSMSIPPLTSNLSFWLWFDSVLFCFFCFFSLRFFLVFLLVIWLDLLSLICPFISWYYVGYLLLVQTFGLWMWTISWLSGRGWWVSAWRFFALKAEE